MTATRSTSELKVSSSRRRCRRMSSSSWTFSIPTESCRAELARELEELLLSSKAALPDAVPSTTSVPSARRHPRSGAIDAGIAAQLAGDPAAARRGRVVGMAGRSTGDRVPERPSRSDDGDQRPAAGPGGRAARFRADPAPRMSADLGGQGRREPRSGPGVDETPRENVQEQLPEALVDAQPPARAGRGPPEEGLTSRDRRIVMGFRPKAVDCKAKIEPDRPPSRRLSLNLQNVSPVAMASTDEELVARSRGGDLEASTSSCCAGSGRSTPSRIASSGARKTRATSAQETFLRAFRALERLQGAGEVLVLALSHHAESVPRLDPARAPAADRAGAGGRRPDRAGRRESTPSESIEELVSRKEISAAVARVMADLPEEQRTAIILKEYHGLTFQEIADMLDCPLSTVKTRLYQGLTVLRRQLRQGAWSPPTRRLSASRPGIRITELTERTPRRAEGEHTGIDHMCDQEILVGYLYGELPPAERSAFDGHLRELRRVPRRSRRAAAAPATVLAGVDAAGARSRLRDVRRAEPVARPARAGGGGCRRPGGSPRRRCSSAPCRRQSPTSR